MAMELELKFAVKSAKILENVEKSEKIRENMVGKPEEIAMKTRYFDNLAGDFTKKRWTLRLRQENEIAVVTLKTKGQDVAGMESRNEWETHCANVEIGAKNLVEQGAPDQLLAMVDVGLFQICGAEFTRRAILLGLAENTQVELALDCGKLTGRRETLDFCEVELELKAGNPEIMKQFALELVEEFPLRPQPKSKFARALTLE